MTYDEGIAVRNGERLNIQCLFTKNDPKPKSSVKHYHYHKYIELLYFLKGSANILIGEETVLCKKGDLFIIYSNEPHVIDHLSDDEYIVIKFLPEILHTADQTLRGFEYLFNFNVGKHSRVIRNIGDNIKTPILDAYRQFSGGSYSGELFVRADIIRICAEIVNFWYSNGEISPINVSDGQDNLAAVQKVMEYTGKTCGAITTCTAADMCNMSRGHFSRTFKSITNMSFMQYVKSVKISEAERLLKCTEKTITDIAQILSYGSTSHFIEDFKREKGITPKQYRKNSYSL